MSFAPVKRMQEPVADAAARWPGRGAADCNVAFRRLGRKNVLTRTRLLESLPRRRRRARRSGRVASASAEDVIVGLITKTEANPFFVKMREGAQEKAKELGITLITAAGKYDGDNDGQVAAVENLIAAGAKGFAIVPSELQGDRADHQEGARRRPDGDRARHAARSDGRGRRHLRHRQPQGRHADRRMGQGRPSATRRPRTPRSSCSTSP